MNTKKGKQKLSFLETGTIQDVDVEEILATGLWHRTIYFYSEDPVHFITTDVHLSIKFLSYLND